MQQWQARTVLTQQNHTYSFITVVQEPLSHMNHYVLKIFMALTRSLLNHVILVVMCQKSYFNNGHNSSDDVTSRWNFNSAVPHTAHWKCAAACGKWCRCWLQPFASSSCPCVPSLVPGCRHMKQPLPMSSVWLDYRLLLNLSLTEDLCHRLCSPSSHWFPPPIHTQNFPLHHIHRPMHIWYYQFYFAAS